jgi:LEA14-like dessication related protein
MSSRIATLAALLLAALLPVLSGCAALGLRDPVSVEVVGLEPLPGEGMETRFMLKLRVQNPNETAIEYDGVFAELDLAGSKLASGVSDQKGVVPRFGEQVISLPMSVPVGAMIRQAIELATGQHTKFAYQLRGKLSGPSFAAQRFESRGELQLPENLFGKQR